jgi:hypothetical protein
MQTFNLREFTAEQIKNGFSYYTLCKLADKVKLCYPWAIVELWDKGHYSQFKGILTVDNLGNYISFE